MPVVIVASFTAKPESVDAVRSACIKAIEAVHDEPGCQLYSLHQAGDTFVFIEQWADAENDTNSPTLMASRNRTRSTDSVTT